MLLQPAHHRGKTLREGAELPGLDKRLLAGPRDPHARRDLDLVDVETRRALVDDIETVVFYHVASSISWGWAEAGDLWIADRYRAISCVLLCVHGLNRVLRGVRTISLGQFENGHEATK